MAEVQLEEKRTVRASQTVQLAEGETQLVITFAEPVPTGKVLDLRVEVAGDYKDATPPA